ncbi:MAG TPA: methyl-accepting chemotaxis protein [Beijerinckiaceae bacterium]|nr:methyl-accepting chemotaxis protein [Beijerinckiaceae bacterium]
MRQLPALAAFRRKPLAIEFEPPDAADSWRGTRSGDDAEAVAVAGAALAAEVADALERDIVGGINAVAKGVNATTGGIRAAGDDLAEIRSRIDELAAAGKGAAKEAVGLAAATHELAGASHAVTRAVDAAAAQLRDAVSSAHGARAVVTDLGSAIEEIAGILVTISAVARQTNLLALNATIEAARAGPAGRDFVLVANDIKSLSVETGNAATEIQARIARLRECAGSSVRVVEKVVSEIEEAQPLVDTVCTAVARQNGALGQLAEQSATTAATAERLSGSLRELNAGAHGPGRRITQAAQTAANAETLANGLAQRFVTIVRQTDGADRRRHDRYPVDLTVTLATAGRSVVTRTVDISAGGVLIAPADGLAEVVGSAVDFDLEPVGRLCARVVAVSAMGLHCAFDHLDPAAQDGLTELMANIEDEYRPLIATVTNAARQIEAAFEHASRNGRLSREQLFDTKYRPIPGTNPPQYGTAYAQVLEDLLPGIQEPLLLSDDRISFCFASDRNGYVPVHNRQYAQPQRPGDLAWNSVNSRNKRIFDHRTDLIAARSSRPFVIQSSTHEVAGRMVVLREIAVPIRVFDRHWGAFRTAYHF